MVVKNIPIVNSQKIFEYDFMRNKDLESANQRPKGSWKGDLMEGLLELIVTLVLGGVALGVGFLILSVYPSERLANVDAEFIILIGAIGLIIPVGIIMIICYFVKKKRGRKMVNLVYKALGKKYGLTRVTLTRKLHDEYTDVYVLKGKTENGSFELYRDGLDLVLAPTAEKEMRLTTSEDAIAEIEKLMAQ